MGYKLTEEEIRRAKKKREFIKAVRAGECEVIDIGNIFGECYITGERREEALKWLESYTTVNLLPASALDNIIKNMKKCEQLFGVTVDTLY